MIEDFTVIHTLYKTLLDLVEYLYDILLEETLISIGNYNKMYGSWMCYAVFTCTCVNMATTCVMFC